MGHSRPRHKNARRKSAQEDKANAILDELLGLVFLRLTSPLDLVRTAFTCRRWRKVIVAEDFRVFSALHGTPSSIVAGHYHIRWSGCCYRPSSRMPHFVPSSSSSWAGVAANNLALDFLPRMANGRLRLELADVQGSLLLLADFNHTEDGKPLVKLSRLVVCDPLAGRYVTIPLSTAFLHTTDVSKFLGAALLHGEDAAARISLSNFRVTCLLYHDGICKTYVFSSAPRGHFWTTSGATEHLDTNTALTLIHFIGSNARFVQWYSFGELGNFILALDREFGELARFDLAVEQGLDENWCHTVPLEMPGGPMCVVHEYVLELSWPPTFRACLS